ncbi:phosphodiesterase [Lysinibacillus yapensis]|uniref:Phosphodiesterase n=1 Tax=Ureibacillus yapensis TaxID=2304605 RepID=A0A396SEU8_9BACL|nr:GGDEF domain-containing phosphodiesterase [Lysinibacillus yapensis]RHW38536.1 phosphodiesterase [Lysinibacillus yapensis]
MHNTNMPLTKDEIFPFLCHISEHFQSGIAIINIKKTDFPFVYCNEAFISLTGFSRDELIGNGISSLRGSITNEEMDAELLHLLSSKAPFEKNVLHYQKDGTAFWNHLTFQPIKERGGITTYALLHCKDITEQMLSKMLSKLEHEVYIELEKDGDLKNTLQLIAEKVERYYIRDIYCAIHIVKENRQLQAIASGSLPLRVIKALNHLEISLTANYNDNVIYINELTLTNHHYNKIIQGYNLSSCWSKPIYSNEKKLLGYISIYIKENHPLKNVDIEFLKKLSPIIALSMKYVEQKQELKRLAFFDKSTGLPNYYNFYNQLEKWVEDKNNGAILLVHPGEYSSIVDLYGRKFGDELIHQIVVRILSLANLKEKMIYVRFSNSSFIVAVKKSNKKLNNFINQILQVTTFPFRIADRDIFITLKIGISHFEENVTLDESIRRADIALTNSHFKNSTISFFKKETDEIIQRELNILNQLHFALQNEEFTVQLQPKIALSTGTIEGFEALARWNSPVLGNVSPSEFIAIAEKSRKINEIDISILKLVLNFLSSRLKNGQKIVPIAVNISPVHFYSESFVLDFISLVEEYEIPPEFIKIEITESAQLMDLDKAKEILSELKMLGYESSIDDFGVGFSSLSYLQQLPFSEIKIDRSFINNISNAEMHAVVQTIVQLAENLRMQVVAEGIETAEQFSILQKMGCKSGQGYYFFKPMSLEQAENLLDTI